MKTGIIFDIDEVCSITFEKELMKEHAQEILVDDYTWFLPLIKTFKASKSSIALINAMSIQHKIIFVTSRNERTRSKTINWINNNYIFPENNTYLLYCREMTDLRSAYLVKKDLYLDHIKDKFDIIFALDDLKRVCKVWQDLDIDSYQVRLAYNKKG